VIKVKLLMDTSGFKDKKIQAMIKLYKDWSMITKEQLKDKIINNEDIPGIDYSHITDLSQMFRT
jgi:hypothetical protein